MNSEIKAKWLEALRSGKYVQGHRRLRRVTDLGKVTHCCLGVLCEVMGVEYGGAQYCPSPSVLAVAGLPEIDYATIDKANEQPLVYLTRMNDGYRDMPIATFSDIAKWIEANL